MYNNQTQRKFLAGILSVVFLAIIILGLNYLFNPSFQKTFFNRSAQSSQVKNGDTTVTSNLDNLLLSIEPESILYKEITLEDLDLYPPAWVEKHFSSSEIVNTLFSGPSADADKDGLINKLEYIYGSDPRNPDSLCNGLIDGRTCFGKNDGENVKNKISPLTGQAIDPLRTFRINSQDESVLKSLEKSLDQASRENVDFPTLYQLSKTVDKTEEVKNISIITTEETRESVIEYSQKQADFIESLVSSDELSSINQIFSYTNSADLTILKNKLEEEREKLIKTIVPNRYADSHRGYIYIYNKLISLTEIRIEVIQANTIDNAESQEKIKAAAVEIVWGYRYLDSLKK